MNRRAAVAALTILITIAPARAAAPSCPDFARAKTINVGLNRGPQVVVVRDFNGDGKDDVAVGNVFAAGDNVSIFLGDGAGGFTEAPGSPVPVGQKPCTMTSGDFNGDGKVDLATANCNSNDVTILLGNGDGTFTQPPGSPFAVGSAPNGIVAGDLNGDGKLDLAIANENDDNVTILLGNGDGTFAAAAGSPIAVGTTPNAIAIGHFDAGATLDLAVANLGSSDVTILLGNGNGAFTPAGGSPVAVGTSPGWIAAGDLNGDGKTDLVTANEGADSISILKGNGDGTFTAAPDITFGTMPAFFVTIDDLNGDGKLDLCVLLTFDYRAAILLGNGDGTFAPPKFYMPDADPETAAVGDFNSDGKKDLVIAHFDIDKISFMYGNGDGSFAALRLFAAGGDRTLAGVFADFNGDGKSDLAVVNADTNTMGVLSGDGKGGFGATTTYPTGSTPFAIAAADFNGDGKTDLAVANQGDATISFFAGNGDGTFAAATTFLAGTSPSAIVAADFNGDGRPDIAVANTASNTVGILLGNGNGTFQPPLFVPVGSSPIAIALADFNGDGRIDLATANSASNDVTILLGNGNGTFLAAGTVTAGSAPSAIVAVDLNGDGKPDLAAANQTSNDVSILIGSGTGTFTAGTSVAVDVDPLSIAVADFDGNGVPDLVTSNKTNDTISVLLGAGNGTFTRTDFSTKPTLISLSGGTHGVVAGDINGDGHSDVAVLKDLGTPDIWIFLSDCLLPATHFSVVAPPTSAAGASFAFTVTPLDQFNHAAGYTGTIHFTSSDAAATLPANANTTGSFNATLKTAGPQTITATDTVISSITGTSNPIAITAGAATHFTITAPASATAGVAFNVTVTALDAFNNVATGYGGSVHFSATDAASTLPANSPLTNGVGSFSVTLRTAGTQTITAADSVNSALTASAPVAVAAAAVTHFVVSAPATATAGAAFSVTVTAFDAFNNIATGYAGTVHFTSSDAASTLPANSPLTNGVRSFNVTLRTAGTQTITAADTVNSSLMAFATVAIAAAAATHFTVSAPATATAGAAFSITVTAFDAFNNTATGYSGTVHFTSSDAASTLPANSTLTNGAGSFSATLRTSGSQSITATDTVNNSITGTSNAIAVQPAAAAHFSISAPSAVASGNAFSFSVTALDSSNNTVANYSGTIHFTSSDGAATLPANSTLTNGTATFSATLVTAGSQTLTATDTGNAAITGTSGAIVVSAPAPSITALSAVLGLTSGGETVTISGLNLSGVTSATFGGVAAVITSGNATSIVVTAPPHAAGPVDVVVTTPGGIATLPHAFTYVTQIPTLSAWMLMLLAAALTIIAIRRV